MELGCVSKYVGNVRPKNIENPRTKRFLDEFKSTNCRLERPTAVIIPGGHEHIWMSMTTPTHLNEHLTLTKQGAEHSPEDGVRQRGKQSRELPH